MTDMETGQSIGLHGWEICASKTKLKCDPQPKHQFNKHSNL